MALTRRHAIKVYIRYLQHNANAFTDDQAVWLQEELARANKIQYHYQITYETNTHRG